jgi:hypothetical protein
MKRHVETQPIYQVIGTCGRAFGPFITETRAAFFATVRWPDQEQDDNKAGHGWHIERTYRNDDDARRVSGFGGGNLW